MKRYPIDIFTLPLKRILLFILAIAAGFLDLFKKYKYPILGPSWTCDEDKYVTMSMNYQAPNIKVLSVENGKAPKSRFVFYYQTYDEPRLKLLREKYKLDDVVAQATSELELLIALREWTRTRFKNREYQPIGRYFDGLDMLEQDRHDIHEFVPGKTYSVCNAISFLYIQVLASMGFQARAVSLVEELGKEENMHCATEVWSDMYGKWLLMDAFLNLYYEKNGIPLNALELHNAIRAGLKDIHIVQGKFYGDGYQNKNYTMNELIGYFKYFRVEFRNDWMTNYYFKGHPKRSDLMSAWWSDTDFPVRGMLSPKTSKADDLYWPLNQVEIFVKKEMEEDDSASCDLRFRTVTPNFKNFEITIDRKNIIVQKEALFLWHLYKGQNSLSVSSVNQYSGKVVPSKIILIKS